MVMAEERRKRAIVSETHLDSAATDARQPDAETGEADEVSDYSEEAGWERSNPKWWLGNGQSLRGSKRPFRAASSEWERLADGLWSVNPRFFKRSSGEQRR
jgi:hypothetical protein